MVMKGEVCTTVMSSNAVRENADTRAKEAGRF
jgi:hypothetical protein